jgi:hypothetical protein
MNYPEPKELHDYSYLGAEKRERERIRRRVNSWCRTLTRLPVLERNAIVDAITDFPFEQTEHSPSAGESEERADPNAAPRSITDAAAAAAYRFARSTIIRQGFAGEIDWQAGIKFHAVLEEHFLREAAWVVLSAGMKESVVRKWFPRISDAFLHWRGACEIVRNREQCVAAACEAFNHRRKIEAIADIAARVHETGFAALKERIAQHGVSYLQTLPFIGSVTCFHLAKNIGLDVVKPDRHLIRAATAAGYSTPHQMCSAISRIVGDPLAVVDLVIWRYATLTPDYIEVFRSDVLSHEGAAFAEV